MTTPQPDLSNVPMGGTVVPGGATFRVWAPRATAVYVSGDFNGWKQNDACKLESLGGGHWAGYFPGLRDGDQYMYYIDGIGSQGYKRDPRARKLTFQPAFPQSNCLLRDPFRFPWHETGFRMVPFNDLIIYQLHVGRFSPGSGSSTGKFLDVVSRVPYLAALGVNAMEPLPIQEYPGFFSCSLVWDIMERTTSVPKTIMVKPTKDGCSNTSIPSMQYCNRRDNLATRTSTSCAEAITSFGRW